MHAGGPDEPEWLDVNRQLWDAMADAHVDSAFYDLAGLVAGRDDLRPWESREVGPVDGKRLLHLQCHLGTDTIGWARLGARCTGLDFSPRAIGIARMLGRWAGFEMSWVEANVYDAVAALDEQRFDVVYTGVGALNWLPNLDRWAHVVADLVEPGGFLYLYEIHPMAMAMDDTGTRLIDDLIGGPFQRLDDGQGTYAAPDAELEVTESFERVHSIDEILSAVLGAGLVIEHYREFDATPSPAPYLERGTDRLYRFPDGATRFPLTFSLRARHP
ncbi:MAG: class I SAM-dependent methyltransferase [Acidimicrobiales bacterium]